MWEEHKLYGGEVSLFFNPVKHWYKVTDPAVDLKRAFVRSTTSFTKGLPWSQGPLLGWTAKVVAADFRERLSSGTVYDEVELNDMERESKKARFRALDKAGDIGTLVHTFCEEFTLWQLGQGEKPSAPDNEEARTSLKQFWKWYNEETPAFLWSERKVYSRRHRYVGTADALRQESGKLIVMDYKSSSGIRLDYWLQSAAYAKAYEEETGEKVEDLQIVWIPKDGEPYQAPLWSDVAKENQGDREEPMTIDDLFDLFLYAKALHDWARMMGEKT